jgi:hypothetical protein
VLSLCSNLVEVIQHFAARPHHYDTQRDNQKGGHFLSSSWQRGAKLRGSFSVDEFSVEATDAVAPVLVFAEFCLCGAAESFFFQGIQL